jgi:hypothetical protein
MKKEPLTKQVFVFAHPCALREASRAEWSQQKELSKPREQLPQEWPKSRRSEQSQAP